MNSSARGASREGGGLAAAQEQAFRLNPGLQVRPLLESSMRVMLHCAQVRSLLHLPVMRRDTSMTESKKAPSQAVGRQATTYVEVHPLGYGVPATFLQPYG